MKQYLELLDRIMFEGRWQNNRTGIRTKRLDGAMLQFDLTQGFPAVTTKKLAFNAVKGELLGFIRGYNNAEDFRKLGCKVWDQNANENEAWLANPNRQGTDDLGRVYGVQWRTWDAGWDAGPKFVDQLSDAVDAIIDNPTSRRIIVNAWNPAELDKMALPPCHMMFQFLVDVESNELSMCMYQRSCDMFLGIPFNIASYALLLELVAMATGRIAKQLTMFLADVHIYENHMDQVNEQLSREPRPLPALNINPLVGTHPTFKMGMPFLETVSPDHIQLVDYYPMPAIKAEMAV